MTSYISKEDWSIFAWPHRFIHKDSIDNSGDFARGISKLYIYVIVTPVTIASFFEAMAMISFL